MASGLPQAEIGIIGGSGFYELFEGDCEEVEIDTRFGSPSGVYTVGTMAGRKVAFLPRHGKNHSHSPSNVNYRANLYGMRQLGVDKVIGACSVGSLSLDIHPGDFVVVDQFVDRTKARKDTYFTHDQTLKVEHLSAAEPYCKEMREVAVKCARDLGITVHDGGAVVTIEGPRFSSKAESEWFSSMGWSCVSMTQYPEAWLARELGLHYAAVCLITDYDAGLGQHDAVTADDVFRVFSENLSKVRSLIETLVPALPETIHDECDANRTLVP